MEIKTIFKMMSHGSYGAFGIEIIVSATKMPAKIDSREIRKAKQNAADILSSAIQKAILDEDPKTVLETKKNRELISKVFSDNIFIEEIPNGYCSDWCCKHLPWFIVTTKIGRIIIGWRKRVISINWEQSLNDTCADDLFPNEDTTKYSRTIHAWSIEKAAEYVKTILTEWSKQP